MKAATGCPESYEELYTHYFGMMKSIVARVGIKPDDVEDVAMDILMRFMQNKGIDQYDPEMLHDVTQKSWNGQQVGRVVDGGPRYRTAAFSGMLRSFTFLSARHFLDKQNSLQAHAPYRLDMPISPANGDSPGEKETWGERNAPRLASPPDLPTTDTVEFTEAIESAHRLRQQRVDAAMAAWAKAQVRAYCLEAKSRQKALYEARRACRSAIEDAFRRERALFTATTLAAKGERVTGTSIAKECGWSAQVGVAMLREAKEDLKASVTI